MELPNSLLKRDKNTKTKCLFISCLAQFDNVSRACRVSGISRETAYQWRKLDQWFAAAWKDAKQDYLDNFEASGRLFALQSQDSNRILAYLKIIHPNYCNNQPSTEDSVSNSDKENTYIDYSKLTVDELKTLEKITEKCVTKHT